MPSENLNISGLQYDIVWEDKDRNIFCIEELINNIDDNCDVIVLPEMFSTGFSMNAKNLAETMNGDTIKWMLNTAKSKDAVITGSLIIKENNYYRNRLLWVDPNGEINYYDKRHSFGLAGENQYFKNGNDMVIFTYKNWKIFASICYDLRFPAWLKNRSDYHILLNVANWPDTRAKHWNSFVNARAIENQSYLIAVNRIGTDGEGRTYSGDSSIIDYDGNVLSKASNTETIINSKLNMQNLLDFRTKFPFLKDQDKFEIIN